MGRRNNKNPWTPKTKHAARIPNAMPPIAAPVRVLVFVSAGTPVGPDVRMITSPAAVAELVGAADIAEEVVVGGAG